MEVNCFHFHIYTIKAYRMVHVWNQKTVRDIALFYDETLEKIKDGEYSQDV